jgi:N-sulfoglucosamine sulfohydrolase
MKILSILFVLSTVCLSAQKRDTRPNILFAIADDWSFGHAGAYDCNWIKTPAFDRVAREGILFHRAYTPNAKCAPSRAIILTGRNSWQLEEAANHMNYFPAKYRGWVETLTESGYEVGYTGKGWGPGIARDDKGNLRQLTGQPFSRSKATPPAKAISNNDYATNFIEFLKQAPRNQPWSFWFGTTEPHRGYEYGSGVKAGKKLSDIDEVPPFWPDNETVRNDMLDYAIEVEHYDHHLGRILDALDQAGLAENTIVVATSDHGMPFPRCKGQAYDYSNHVPLAIRWPAGIKGNRRQVDDYVSFADFAPTFLEAARVDRRKTRMQPFVGKSLFDLFQSPKSGQVNLERDFQLVGKERHDVGRPYSRGYPIRGIIKREILYLRNFENDRWPVGNPETGYLNCDASPIKTVILNQRRAGEEEFWRMNFGKRPVNEMYDLRKDPYCVNNLAGMEKYQEVERRLRTQLFAELEKQRDPRVLDRGFIFDKYPFVGDWNNFYERYVSGKKTPRTGWVNSNDYEKSPLD